MRLEKPLLASAGIGLWAGANVLLSLLATWLLLLLYQASTVRLLIVPIYL